MILVKIHLRFRRNQLNCEIRAKDAKKRQAASCNGASKVCNSEYILEKKIILLVSGCILFAFFWHFSSLTTISLIKKKAMDIQGGLPPKKQRKRKKKHEMQYFLWIIYQF